MSDRAQDPGTPGGETAKVAVILHYSDFRGDHSKDARKILWLDHATPLGTLAQMVEERSGYGDASIEVVRIEETPHG